MGKCDRTFISKQRREKHDLVLETFQIKYNALRKNLKKRIRSSHTNLLTYDYEMSRIIRDIDIFFDSTIKILFKRKVMSIPFSPHDEYDMLIDEEQSRLNDERWVQPPPSQYEFEAWEIKNIDFSTINTFLRYFGDIVIRKPKSKSINTVAIGELFRRWNSIIMKINNDVYEESKGDVDKYYDERRERRSFLLKTIYDLGVLLISGLIIPLIIYLITKSST
jgi:hypothetical protein